MGWFLITIALPLVVPVALLLCMKAAPIPAPPERMNPITLVKDGQLCWAAIAFCASGMYELIEQVFDGPGYDRTVTGYLSFGLISTMIISGVLAACGPVFPTSLGRPASLSWYRHYRLLAFSMVMVAISSGIYATIHYGLLRSDAITEEINACMDRKAIRGPGPSPDADRDDLYLDRVPGTGPGGHRCLLPPPLAALAKKIARKLRAIFTMKRTSSLALAAA